MSRRDYSSKIHKYQTPRKLVRRDKLKGEIIKKRLRFLTIAIGSFSLILSAAYWLFFAPIFHLTNITLENESGPATHAELLQKVNEIFNSRVFFILPKSSYFLFSAKEAEKTLNDFTDYQPSIENITAQVKFPNRINILFKQKIPRLKVVVRPVTVENEEQIVASDADVELDFQIEPPLYLVDAQGVIVAERMEDKSYDILPIVHLLTKTSEPFALGKQIFSNDVVSSTIAMYDFFKAHLIALPQIDYIEFSEDNLMEGAIHTSVGFIVYVSFKHSLQEQLNRLLLTLENVKDKKDNLSYIDLRIENRAYLCCNLGIEKQKN